MIAKLSGKVDLIHNGYVILMAGGVGYKIFMTGIGIGNIAKKENAEIYIHTHVREDNISLYGFETQTELDIFELLLSVSGIGPKVALGILSIASPANIKNAIVEEDSSILTKVSGVGKKTADRVILELRNKVDELPVAEKLDAQSHQDVVEALVAMGYSVSEAREAYRAIPKNIKDISEKIKYALKAMKK